MCRLSPSRPTSQLSQTALADKDDDHHRNPHSSPFRTRRINGTTFVIHEADPFDEKPLIYAKLHPTLPVLVLSDTGCDQPDRVPRHKDDRHKHLRDYLENCPVAVNHDRPLNPIGPDNKRRTYIIISTHCHYDHLGGIEQFVAGGTTETIAAAAGRDFIESDLWTHGGFKGRDMPVPKFKFTHWAESFERLRIPLEKPWTEANASPPTPKEDLGITIISTPGHTPDELAWYDHEEMHLSVGDSFYEELGPDDDEKDHDARIPIMFSSESNLIEWVFAMQKLLVFVRSENARAAEAAAQQMSAGGEGKEGWVAVARRVQVSCAHQTTSMDGDTILSTLEKFSSQVFAGKVPVVEKEFVEGEMICTWRAMEDDGVRTKYRMSLQAPLRLMNDARRFFNLTVPDDE